MNREVSSERNELLSNKLCWCVKNILILHRYQHQHYTMKEGKVKFFNESKGYGFIKDIESDEEYFVHVSGLIDKIKEDDDVTFDLTEGRKGLNAVNVKLI